MRVKLSGTSRCATGSSRGSRPACRHAVGTARWPFRRNCCTLLRTSRAADAHRRRRRSRRHRSSCAAAGTCALGLAGRAAIGATIGLVREALRCEELLLAGAEREGCVAINAVEGFVCIQCRELQDLILLERHSTQLAVPGTVTMQQDHADNLTPDRAGTRALPGTSDHNTKVARKLQVKACLGRFGRYDS